MGNNQNRQFALTFAQAHQIGIGPLAHCPKIFVLDLTHCPLVRDACMQKLVAKTCLVDVNISGCKVRPHGQTHRHTKLIQIDRQSVRQTKLGVVRIVPTVEMSCELSSS